MSILPKGWSLRRKPGITVHVSILAGKTPEETGREVLAAIRAYEARHGKGGPA